MVTLRQGLGYTEAHGVLHPHKCLLWQRSGLPVPWLNRTDDGSQLQQEKLLLSRHGLTPPLAGRWYGFPRVTPGCGKC